MRKESATAQFPIISLALSLSSNIKLFVATIDKKGLIAGVVLLQRNTCIYICDHREGGLPLCAKYESYLNRHKDWLKLAEHGSLRLKLGYERK